MFSIVGGGAEHTSKRVQPDWRRPAWNGWRVLAVTLAFLAPYAAFYLRIVHETDPNDPLMTPAMLAVRL
ncbi:hypothetical protein, partial [Nevskia soli]|uniref:hypothetical protein n=1 Tax=Nevskia soli TaxID=418856 RepID=UPI001B809651